MTGAADSGLAVAPLVFGKAKTDNVQRLVGVGRRVPVAVEKAEPVWSIGSIAT